MYLPDLVLLLADKGFISLDVEYINSVKIESKANNIYFCISTRQSNGTVRD